MTIDRDAVTTEYIRLMVFYASVGFKVNGSIALNDVVLDELTTVDDLPDWLRGNVREDVDEFLDAMESDIERELPDLAPADIGELLWESRNYEARGFYSRRQAPGDIWERLAYRADSMGSDILRAEVVVDDPTVDPERRYHNDNLQMDTLRIWQGEWAT